jgi:predicted ATPase/class 3 adenylate cyclase
LPAGEVSLLFSDIEGSTRLLDRLGDAYGDVLAEHRRVLRKVWAAHGGVEVDTEGDAFFVAFPVAAEAVAAAGDAQRVVADAEQLAGVKVRIGVHTGAPKIRDEDYWGVDVHYAARLCSAAHGGQVLLSETTQRLVSEPETEDLGEHALKDFPTPRHVFHLRIDGRGSDRFPAIRSVPTGGTNLPDQISSFIGRTRELAALRQLIPESRLVSLVGAGGVGKTRLALQLGAELLDGKGGGVWLVELAPLPTAERVSLAVAETLRAPVRPGGDVAEQIASVIADRQMLLILDNCEHVVDPAAELVRRLLGSCPGLVVLVTSRASLGVDGEQVYRVPSLSTPQQGRDGLEEVRRSEAARLFIERACQQRTDFVLTEELAPVLARLCRRLDGIALAIELAAVRLRSLSLPELEARLDQRFRLLRAGGRGGRLPRHQTLQALIDWSYDLLSPVEQEVLARLSAFAPSGFDLTACEAVSASETIVEAEVVDHLDALVDKSLVQADDASGAIRYRLLETIRAYAGDKLRAGGAQTTARVLRVHRNHYLSLAESIGAEMASGGDLASLCDRLDTEYDNVRLALAYSLTDPDPHPGFRFARALGRFWRERGATVHEVTGYLAELLARPDTQQPSIERGYALQNLGFTLLWGMGEGARSRGHLEEALRIAELHGDDHLLVRTLTALGYLTGFSGDRELGLEFCERAERIARSLHDEQQVMSLTVLRGNLYVQQGRDARPIFREVLDTELRDGGQVGLALHHVAIAELAKGDLRGARAHCEQALPMFNEAHDTLGGAWLLQTLAEVRYLEHDYAAAAGLLTEALQELQHHDPADLAMNLVGIAETAENPAAAAKLHGAAGVIAQASIACQAAFELEIWRASEARLRAVLGDCDFDAARDAGSRLTRADALTLARDTAGTTRRI